MRMAITHSGDEARSHYHRACRPPTGIVAHCRGGRRGSAYALSLGACSAFPRGLIVACALLAMAGIARAQETSSGADASGPTPRPASEQFIKVSAGDRVTMHVSGLPLADAVRMLSEPTRRNIILADGVKGAVTASLYNVGFDEALTAMLVSNNLGYRPEGNFIYVYPLEKLAQIMDAQRKIEARVFKLSYLNAAAVKPLIEPMLSRIGKVAVTPPATKGLGGTSSGGSSSSSSSSGGSNGVTTEGDAVASPDTLLVTDYEDRLDDIDRVIKEIDQRPRQVLIEATIMRASLHDDTALGIDFTTVGGIDFQQVNSISPAAQSIATGLIPENQLQNTNFTVRNELNQSLPAGGFTFGIIKDQVGVFVRALEQVTDTEVLANPKILALNKQIGHVLVGRRDGYITTTITETTAIQKVEFLETGTLLTFRPFINEDATVRMEIHPKDSTGGLTEANLPFEQTTEVTSNVIVKDGHTILIGGLFREVSAATRGQMPLLGNLPVVGPLFRRTRDDSVREEVVILLTVHVVKGDADMQASLEMREDVERFRVGMRQGLQWFGRERLAEAHYRWALEHLAGGDDAKALWDAQMALNNYPRHVDAAKLKEKITGRRDWESEASSIRHYVHDRINEENGIQAPPFGRPAAPPFHEADEIEGPSGIEEDEPRDSGGATSVTGRAEGPPRSESTERGSPRESDSKVQAMGRSTLLPQESDRSADIARVDENVSPMGRSALSPKGEEAP